jgi:NAD(P)-dependent dehydrogenase (short-subunit alcohol dehydrogenase family)
MGEAVARRRVELGFASSLEELAGQRAADFPLGRVGTVGDVAEAILFLLSDSSAWISGESLNVDGGSLAG